MKYSAALSLALSGSVMAAGTADVVNQVLTDIGGAIKSFDTAIKGYSGGDSKTLIDAAGKIQSLTEGGAAKISSSPDLTLNDAVSITTTVQGLQGTLDSALSDLEGIGSKLAAAGQCGTISTSLTAQGAAAKQLQDAITSKAPAETKTIAQQLGGKIGASISNTQSKFKEVCAGAPSGGSSSGGSSSGSSTGSAGGASHSGMAGMGGSSSGSSSSGSSAGSSSGSSTGSSAKPAKSSGLAKPAQFQGSGSQLSAGASLAIAAALLAL